MSYTCFAEVCVETPVEGRLSSGKVVKSGMFIEDVISNETNFRDAGPFASSIVR